MRSTDEPARAVTLVAALVAAAAVLGLAEAVLLPDLVVPGVRLGLANVPLLIAVVALRARGSLTVALGKTIVVGLATGVLFGPAGLMSAAGCLAAWAAAVTLASARRLTLVGLGIGAASAHVAAQYAAASILAGSTAPLRVLPLALALSVATGSVTGLCAALLANRAPLRLVDPGEEGERPCRTFSEGAAAPGPSF